jgi:proline iminopeptidase
VPPTADQDPALPHIRIQVAGHERAVHLRRFGDPASPLLLVLHGSLADMRALLPFRALADRYHVVLWDQRGNGLSERITASEYTVQSIVDEIDALRRRFSPATPVTLLGHSFGASYAALYMSRHPEHVRQAVLMEPPGLNGAIMTATLPSLYNVDLLGRGLNAMFWQSELLSAAHHEAMDYRALMLLLDGRQSNYFCDPDHPPRLPVWRPGAYVEHLRGALLGMTGSTFDFDFARGLDAFEPEVLILAGRCSALGGAFQRHHHLPLFARARVVEVAGAGHRLFVERPDRVLAEIRGYLAEYGPRTPPAP